MTLPLENHSNGSDGEGHHEEHQPPVRVESSDDLEAMNTRIAELAVQLRALEQLPSLMASLQDQADGLATTQRRTDHKLSRAAEDAARVQQQMEGLGESVQIAASLKRDITQYEQLIPETKQQLKDLEAMASGVTQQVDALEEQRAAIDRAVEKAKELDTVLQQIEQVAEKQQEQTDRLAGLEASAESLKSLDQEALERVEQIRSHQVQLDAQDQATLEELAAIRAAVDRSLERVEFSNREFESLNRRVEQLRDGLGEMETQMGVLEASGEAISEIQSLAVDLSQRMRTISDDCARLPELDAGLERVRSVHVEVQQRSEHLTTKQAEIDEKITAQQKELEWQIATQQQEIDEQIATQQRKLSEQMDSQQEEIEHRIAGQKQDVVAQIAAQQREINEMTTAVQDDLAEMREEVGKAVERVNTSTRAYDAVTEQTTALRADLEDLEERHDVLRESRHAIAATEREAEALRAQLSSMTEDLNTRLSTVAEECNRLDDEAERIRTIRGDSDKLDEAVYEIEQRVVKIESVRTEVDAASRDLADLSRKSEAITNSMRQVREARNEVSQMRDEHVETQKWLTELEGTVSALHTSVEDLHGMKPMVEFVREEAERVSDAMATMESRRDFLQELDRRMVELESLGARLGDGVERTPSRPDAKRGWRFDPSLSFDKSTWEFGLQLRFAGRWKRGVALWLGPIRWFVGWAWRGDAAESEQQEIQPVAESG